MLIKGKTITELVGLAANCATILAFIVAVIALIQPGWVAEYLSAIERNTANIQASAESIDKNTKSTADNTQLLADEIPYWVKFEDLRFFAGEDNGIGFRLVNRSNFTINDLHVTILSGGNTIKSFDRFALPANEKIWLKDGSLSGPPEFICVKGTTTRSNKELFEVRQLDLSKAGTDTAWLSQNISFSPIPSCAD